MSVDAASNQGSVMSKNMAVVSLWIVARSPLLPQATPASRTDQGHTLSVMMWIWHHLQTAKTPSTNEPLKPRRQSMTVEPSKWAHTTCCNDSATDHS